MRRSINVLDAHNCGPSTEYFWMCQSASIPVEIKFSYRIVQSLKKRKLFFHQAPRIDHDAKRRLIDFKNNLVEVSEHEVFREQV